MFNTPLTPEQIYADIRAGVALVYYQPVFMDNIESFTIAFDTATRFGCLDKTTTERILDLIFRDLNNDARKHKTNNLDLSIKIGEFVADFTHTHKYHDWQSFISHLSSPVEKFTYYYSLYKYGDVHINNLSIQSYLRTVKDALEGTIDYDLFDWTSDTVRENVLRGFVSLCQEVSSEHCEPILYASDCINQLHVRTPDIWKKLDTKDQMNMVRLDFYNYKLLCEKDMARFYSTYLDKLMLPIGFDRNALSMDNITAYLSSLYKEVLPTSFFTQLQLRHELFDLTDLNVELLTEIFVSSSTGVDNHPIPLMY